MDMDRKDFLSYCSDEETYFESNIKYRTSKQNVRIWEPSGKDIVDLYQKIKTNSFVELEWQCPGRISPSQVDQINVDQFQKSQNNHESERSEPTKTEFDFDNDFDDDSTVMNNSKSSRVLKNKSQVIKKSQTTNLTKVMQDIKKYQFQSMDHT